MSDLISRQAAIDAIRAFYDEFNDNEKSIEELISELPTIDPVKRGKWIGREKYRTTKDGVFHTYRFKVCSECGRCSGRKMNRPTPFCPNCGARMDGE